VLLETKDRTNFQGHYILRHPWTGKIACEAGEKYREALPTGSRQPRQPHRLVADGDRSADGSQRAVVLTEVMAPPSAGFSMSIRERAIAP
jgi:hypothetical protein